jgi:hypothetical protein
MVGQPAAGSATGQAGGAEHKQEAISVPEAAERAGQIQS